MSDNADTIYEPKVESADAGPKIAEAGDEPETEPLRGEKHVEKDVEKDEEKIESTGVAPVCLTSFSFISYETGKNDLDNEWVIVQTLADQTTAAASTTAASTAASTATAAA